MPFFTYDDDLRDGVEPLSKSERAWISRLEKVLLSCPTERLHLVTIGDPDLSVVDIKVAISEGVELSDGGASSGGVELANVKSRPNIHGVAG